MYNLAFTVRCESQEARQLEPLHQLQPLQEARRLEPSSREVAAALRACLEEENEAKRVTKVVR